MNLVELKATHLMEWLHDGYNHCRYGSEDWCKSYLTNAREYITALEASNARLQKEIETAREEARNAVKTAYERRLKKYRSGCACHLAEDGETLLSICEAHRALLDTARENAFEEAARTAESTTASGYGEDIAAAIRALQDKEVAGWQLTTS